MGISENTELQVVLNQKIGFSSTWPAADPSINSFGTCAPSLNFSQVASKGDLT